MIEVNFEQEIDAERTLKALKEIAADPMGGWLMWPHGVTVDYLTRIKNLARKIREESDYLVCIGIGGSYLGHRAVIESLWPQSETKIVYAGNSLSERELKRVLAEVGEADFSINVISKSGTTLEPERAFLAFRDKLVAKYGEAGATERIYATTDAEHGKLHDESVTKGYTRLVIPDGIGGRFSVLTSVGLLPMAVAGINVDAIIAGAAEKSREVARLLGGEVDEESERRFLNNNPAVQYAWMRYELSSRGYDTEVFASFEPATWCLNEWIKQLFGESEGKGGRGIWPASVVYSTDLHSLGQFLQDGRRNLFETIIDFPTDELNAKLVRAVQFSHASGGIPVLMIGGTAYDAKGLGELMYFFQIAAALSAKLFGVNPFDQPGVEVYKQKLREIAATK